MKKISYLFLAGMATLAACQQGPSYKIKGIAQNIENGDTIYLQEFKNGVMTKIDSTTVKEGTFFFVGRQDDAVNRYITYIKGDKRFFTDFFLENGNIDVTLGEKSEVTGTENNKIYGEIKAFFTEFQNSLREEYQQIKSNESLTEEEQETAMQKFDERNKSGMQTIFEMLKKNMSNPVGVFLLPQYASAYDLSQQKELLSLIPASMLENEQIKELQGRIDTIEKTAVGQKYIDFSMNTPEGELVKLSDFVSKNKYTLIDFWASWCGPCHAEMPYVIAAYEKYKAKGLGIVGVSLDNNADKWKDGIKTLKMPWPQMSDLAGWNCEGSTLYGVRSIPATVLIDQDGIIIARNLRGKALEEKFAELLP